jgi:hypothetical protein
MGIFWLETRPIYMPDSGRLEIFFNGRLENATKIPGISHTVYDTVPAVIPAGRTRQIRKEFLHSEKEQIKAYETVYRCSRICCYRAPDSGACGPGVCRRRG